MVELFNILNPYDDWQNDAGEEENLKARQALVSFYQEIKKLKPDRKYHIYYLHISYFHYLLRIKKAFLENKYMRVCNEIMSLMYYEPFFQPRIYYNVIKVLEEGLEFGGIDDVENL